MDLDFFNTFKDVIQKMDEAGNIYADLKSDSWYQQELKGSILSSIISKQGDIPVSRAEIIARGSEDYRQYLRETAEAIKKELKAKSNYEKEKARFEAYRSLSSLEKKTRSLIGGE